MTSRDKKVLFGLVVLAVIAGYWFLILGPQRDAASKASAQLKEQTTKRDAALARERDLAGARTRYAADYAAVVRLGKAVPATVDMPSLLLQLDRASKGSGIDFESIKAGDRAPAVATAAPTPAPPTSGSQKGTPAAGGGEAAQSAPGKVNETASNKVDQANAASASAEQQNGLNSGDSKTSKAANNGALPVGGGGAGGTAAADQPQGSGAPGLDAVPLEFSFNGDYFELADFLHRLKRFVYVANDGVKVRGRLMTIDSFKFSTAGNRRQGRQGGQPQGRRQGDRLPLPEAGGRHRRRHATGTGCGVRHSPGGLLDQAGPDARPDCPDRHRDAMKVFFLDLWQDLREKRLWPVAAGLLIAVIAVPVLLLNSGSGDSGGQDCSSGGRPRERPVGRGRQPSRRDDRELRPQLV